MLNMLPYNDKKLNEYDYYHIALLLNKKIMDTDYDLTLENVTHKVNENKDKFDLKIIGTSAKIDNCVDYVNRCCNDGILLFFDREDVFVSDISIFVDCTVYFTNIMNKENSK